MEAKKNTLFLILCGIFITNALVAEIVGAKIFSLEQFLGLPPAQIQLFTDYPLNFELTAGVVLWPFVFILSDIINEYFGKAGVKKISLFTCILIIYVFVIIWIVTALPPAKFWIDLNNTDSAGNPLNIDLAFAKIFRQGMSIIAGSITAFLVGQLLDASVFQWLRSITGSKKIWVRATGSTLVSQLIDSFVVLMIAFYFFGNWSMDLVISVGLMNYLYKFIVAIAMTPILYGVHYLIEQYLGKKNAEELSEQASKTTVF